MSFVKKEVLGKATIFIGKITGFLVLTTALINGSVDLYRAINNIPTSQSERDNKEYYKKYFGHKPVFQGDVPLITDNGNVTIGLEVHSEGDILVKYGTRSQWFPFPSFNSSGLAFNVISSAHADDHVSENSNYTEEPVDTYKQFETQKEGNIIRSQYFPDGKLQVITIDPVTGNISVSKPQNYGNVPSVFPNPTTKKPTLPNVINVYQFPTIDVTSE
ncbi:hypothetical protein [Vibrio parahaemolyticus]|uniref:hypothetical protein n=1 Tax=Vibrio harveyi group TaxID=717610 RepID=UPI00215C6EFD|nr:hypothetical protein [Vibrio parahaemolyticus]MCR9643649.1 hypothetical protein [Vibrio parahaemolyticus]MCR9798121.1 hypothetical protein [Vibrio parahaemolyticus]MDF4314090.1 hypothetical protein [Vibrio parahaemolyticus]